jgi:hypothetical protein
LRDEQIVTPPAAERNGSSRRPTTSAQPFMARIGERLLVDPALPSIIGQPELSTSPAAGAASTRLRAVGSTPHAQITQVEHARAVGVGAGRTRPGTGLPIVLLTPERCR